MLMSQLLIRSLSNIKYFMNFEEHNTYILYTKTSVKPNVNPTC